MKKTTTRDHASVFLVGRGFIVLSIFVVSSLGFILGYFVGKNTRQSTDIQTLSISDQQEGIEKEYITHEEIDTVSQKPEQSPINEQIGEKKAPRETLQSKEGQGTRDFTSLAEPEESSEVKKNTRKKTYAVQVGAFRNLIDAKSLKAELDKKGYGTYIIPSETKRHQLLYKVLIGKYATRKEADVLSNKIRSSEGLKTFVTIKPFKEELR